MAMPPTCRSARPSVSALASNSAVRAASGTKTSPDGPFAQAMAGAQGVSGSPRSNTPRPLAALAGSTCSALAAPAPYAGLR